MALRLTFLSLFLAGSCFGAGISGYPFYRTVSETYAALTNLATMYPTLATLTNIGTTYQDRPIMGIVLTSQVQSTNKYVTLFTGNTHPNELGPAELLTRFAEKVVTGYATNADYRYALDWGAIYIVPIYNVDSRVLVDSGLSSTGKNQNNTECAEGYYGVNLNRNFPFMWGFVGGSAISNSCEGSYFGSGPASEPETQALTNLIGKLFTDQRGTAETDAAGTNATGMYFDIHTWTASYNIPWSHTNAAAPDDAELRGFASKLKFYTDYTIGRSWETGSGYIAGGASSYAYGTYGICSFPWELLGADAILTGTEFTNAVTTNMPALAWTVKVGPKPYLSTHGPDVLNISIGAGLAVTATADDTRNGTETDQDISSARYAIDAPGWTGATTRSLGVTKTDTGTATLSGTIDVSGISTGDHLLYLEAQDAGGTWGVVSAQFFTFHHASGAAANVGTMKMSQ